MSITADDLLYRLACIAANLKGEPLPPPPPPRPVIEAVPQDGGIVWDLAMIERGESAYCIERRPADGLPMRIARLQQCEAQFRKEAAESAAFARELREGVEEWERASGITPPPNASLAQRTALMLFKDEDEDEDDAAPAQ
jgi:hypothetical protein